ncbi:unnamed protein product [Periconia digitata]|uniref:SAP domain-containing protein n=1 Tax=Periconia digitata TaxID=1303443 RepID=A0A9W4UBU3_9PLEO|nr:unnamed protein product [Periconia digitata]
MAPKKAQSYSRTTLNDLIALASSRGLDTHGTKIEVTARLVKQDQEQEQENMRSRVNTNAASVSAAMYAPPTSSKSSHQEPCASTQRARTQRARKARKARKAPANNANQDSQSSSSSSSSTVTQNTQSDPTADQAYINHVKAVEDPPTTKTIKPANLTTAHFPLYPAFPITIDISQNRLVTITPTLTTTLSIPAKHNELGRDGLESMRA